MDPKVTELYNDYIHGDMPRRSFLKQLVIITGGATMANAVLALVEPNYALGQQINPEDDRLQQGYITYEGSKGPVRAYFAKPAGAKHALPGILVIHENRGLIDSADDALRR
jgi:carboxymethylenebutenolidase